MKDIRSFISRDNFAAAAGVELVSFGNGEAVTRMTLTDLHRNAAGAAMGGAIFTLADAAFAAAANTRPGITVSLTATVSFLRPAAEGVLTARAVTVSAGKTTCCVDVTVTDGRGRPVAKLQCTGYTREKEA